MLGKVADWFGYGKAAAANSHDHGRGTHHGHTHGVVDPTIATTERGIWAIKWSFVILAATAALQLVVVFVSGSVALLADTIHNIGDAATAIPLWVAFMLARRPPTATFSYGYGRVEDLAGILIVLIILFSAAVAGYEAIDRLITPRPIANLGWVAAAGIIGFLGNEAVAVFRIRVGRQINSAALIADGYHARTDGLTSLAVVLGAFGVALGFPLADALIGLLITVAILGIVWQSARAVLTRMLDGVEPGVMAEIRHAIEHVSGMNRVTKTQARWVGHRLHVALQVAVDDGMLLASARDIARALKRELRAHLPALEDVRVEFARPEAGSPGDTDSHHHAPSPFRIKSKLAEGLLEIVETPEGERLRLRVSRHAEKLQASVDIERSGGRLESLPLRPLAQDHHCLETSEAPSEPHEFSAILRLSSDAEREDLRFRMSEPAHHHH